MLSSIPTERFLNTNEWFFYQCNNFFRVLISEQIGFGHLKNQHNKTLIASSQYEKLIWNCIYFKSEMEWLRLMNVLTSEAETDECYTALHTLQSCSVRDTWMCNVVFL